MTQCQLCGSPIWPGDLVCRNCNPYSKPKTTQELSELQRHTSLLAIIARSVAKDPSDRAEIAMLTGTDPQKP